MARPPMGDKAQDYTMRIRMTMEERLELETAAGDSPPSTWAREQLLAIARRKKSAKKKRKA